MDERRTSTNVPEDKKVDEGAQGLIFERWHRQIMCQEKKEEKDSPVLKMANMHQYEDSKTS